MLPVNLYNLDECNQNELTRVVIVSKFKGQWLLCRHKEKGTWEIPGGHIEKNGNWLAAAKRELEEETGVKNAEIKKVCLYKISTFGLLCYAEIKNLENNKLTFEMDQIGLFDELPSNMTYYDTHKLFVDKVKKDVL